MTRLLVVLAALAAAAPSFASQPQFWKVEGAQDFLQGETNGLSVDSQGRVRLAPTSKLIYTPETPYVWALARDAKGALYAGTGNDGKVFRVSDKGETGALFFDAPELEVHALAVGPDGRLYVGTGPEGKVWAVDEAGKATLFFDPADKYIWALAFDKQGQLLVATGAEGRVYRVTKDGKSTTLLTSAEVHITALAVDDAGRVYAGSSPEGIIYRIDTGGKVFVLHDASFREVKALEVGRDGSLYAAVVEGSTKPDAAPAPPAAPPTMAMPPIADVTVSESFAIAPTAFLSQTATPPRAVGGGAVKGALLRIAPSGEVDTIWSSADETPHALLATPEGLLVGTGDKGKLYRVKDDRTWSMLGSFPAEQVTALLRDASGAVVLATSNPAKVHVVQAAPGTTGSFVSKAQDTETVSSWGRIRWQAAAPSGTHITVFSRSGNTANPDSTWSDWSPGYTHADGEAVSSERARFLQLKAVLDGGKGGGTPVLDSITAAYLPRNLRPQVQSVTVHPPGEIFQKPLSLTGEIEILGLDTPVSPEARPGAAAQKNALQMPVTTYSRKLYQKGIQTLSWKADDPNQDTLSYDVLYRPVADTRYRLLRRGLTEAVLAWDTSTVPNGRYVVDVVASDAPSNPDALALVADKESEPFDVDNTPPTVTASLASTAPLKVRAVAHDDNSLLRRAEYSVDGGRWEEVHPVDGINDSQDETYEFTPGPFTGAGSHVIVVRATDLLGNVSTSRVEVP